MQKRYVFPSLLLLVTLGLGSCELDELFPKDPSVRISGNWQCKETSEVFNNSTFTVEITKGGNQQEILIKNFYNLSGKSVIATVDGQDILIIEQEVDGNIISGDGSISRDFSEIELYYDVDDQSGPIDHVSAVLTPL